MFAIVPIFEFYQIMAVVIGGIFVADYIIYRTGHQTKESYRRSTKQLIITVVSMIVGYFLFSLYLK